MGQMKWIYGLIQDNKTDEFKEAFYNAIKNEKYGFDFDGKFIDIIKAGSIMKVMEKGLKEYNAHLDAQAELEREQAHWLSVQNYLNS